MPNPAPFPPTAYDLPDWTRAVVAVTPSGTGAAPATVAGAVVTGNNKQSFYTFTSSASFSEVLGPNDGKQHYLTYVSMSIWLIAGTISGTVLAQASLIDNGSPNHTMAITTVYANGLPTSGQMPSALTELSFAGGVAIAVQPNLTNQLEWLISVNGVNGGTISGSRIESYLAVGWT